MTIRALVLFALLAVVAGAVVLLLRGDDAAARESMVAPARRAQHASPPPPPSLAVPTREQLGYATTPVLREPEPSKEVAPPHIVAELEDVRARMREGARSCSGAAGHSFELQVDVAFAQGEAHVRSARIISGSLGAAIDRCIEQALAGQRWSVASPNKQFGLRIPIEL